MPETDIKYLLDDGMVALLKWMEKEGQSVQEIHKEIELNGSLSLKDEKAYDTLEIHQRNDGDPYLVAKVKKDGWDLSRIGFSVPSKMMPESIVHRIMAEARYPAQKVINHPYLKGALITAIHADTVTTDEVIMMIKRRKPRFVLSSDGIEPRFKN